MPEMSMVNTLSNYTVDIQYTVSIIIIFPHQSTPWFDIQCQSVKPSDLRNCRRHAHLPVFVHTPAATHTLGHAQTPEVCPCERNGMCERNR